MTKELSKIKTLSFTLLVTMTSCAIGVVCLSTNSNVEYNKIIVVKNNYYYNIKNEYSKKSISTFSISKLISETNSLKLKQILDIIFINPKIYKSKIVNNSFCFNINKNYFLELSFYNINNPNKAGPVLC